ncbi:unnamed protein product [marine sediment metagenome]|uniref:Uncharacterized protein n=1 Tax=marine sediment metagenome TaxID=412755 RepID=X1B0G3_9ZZZZ
MLVSEIEYLLKLFKESKIITDDQENQAKLILKNNAMNEFSDGNRSVGIRW